MLAEPGSGHVERLREIAGAAAGAGAHLTIVLVGDPADDAKGWESAAPDAEVVVASEGSEPRDQARMTELAVARAKRRAETGADAVVVIDSLSSLALGYRQISRLKRLLEAGRDLEDEGRGSLTVIGTVVEGDERGEEVRKALEGSEDVLLEAE
jgi:transcription termination factor Rho